MAKVAGSRLGWYRLTCRTVRALSVDGRLGRREHRQKDVVGA